MAFTELVAISIFVSHSLQSLVILGESVLSSDTDKRANNFQIPVEMPYDPNFWPSRGRRGTHPARVLRDICDVFGKDFLFDKHALRCPAPEPQDEDPNKWKWPLSDADAKPNDDLLTGCSKMGSYDRNCNEETEFPVTEQSRDKPTKRLSDVLDAEVQLASKWSSELQNKKQRRFRIPKIIFYGNGVFWEHGNPYAEKKKKQDVFWVARGKKNFLRQP